jgi:ERCC4-related helicase
VGGQGVCSLRTGVAKTLVAVLWLKSTLEAGHVKNALILEPTRLLVNQTSDYFFYKAGVESIPIDGRIPRPRRAELWQSEVIVATPETTFNHIDFVDFDAVVVDECHHTVGQDAFSRVMHQLCPSYRLGLSAFIPARREREITELIGPIRRWSWSDPEIAPYVPNCIGEVYEANLSNGELELLRVIRQLPTGDGLNPALLERYLTRDGSVAVRETLTNKNRRLAQAFGEMLLPMVPEGMHKLETVNEVIDSHEPRKAIIFVDRVVIADKVGALFPQMQPVVFKGKRGKFDQGTALHQARNEETRLVASTSAGEEGIDLPSADLLVIWGNAASDIRFIQRLGRMMRKTGEGLKFATFVVTPESSDFDSFALGLAKAAETRAIDVEKTFGWDPEVCPCGFTNIFEGTIILVKGVRICP